MKQKHPPTVYRCTNAQLVQRLREEANKLSNYTMGEDLSVWYLAEVIDEVEKRMCPSPRKSLRDEIT